MAAGALPGALPRLGPPLFPAATRSRTEKGTSPPTSLHSMLPVLPALESIASTSERASPTNIVRAPRRYPTSDMLVRSISGTAAPVGGALEQMPVRHLYTDAPAAPFAAGSCPSGLSPLYQGSSFSSHSPGDGGSSAAQRSRSVSPTKIPARERLGGGAAASPMMPPPDHPSCPTIVPPINLSSASQPAPSMLPQLPQRSSKSRLVPVGHASGHEGAASGSIERRGGETIPVILGQLSGDVHHAAAHDPFAARCIPSTRSQQAAALQRCSS